MLRSNRFDFHLPAQRRGDEAAALLVDFAVSKPQLLLKTATSSSASPAPFVILQAARLQ